MHGSIFLLFKCGAGWGRWYGHARLVRGYLYTLSHVSKNQRRLLLKIVKAIFDSNTCLWRLIHERERERERGWGGGRGGVRIIDYLIITQAQMNFVFFRFIPCLLKYH